MSIATQASVLVVEDERSTAEAYARVLDDEYAVEVATTGEHALELLDESTDVVLLDRRMPGLSGAEVLAEIAERSVDCRVAMVTAVEPGFDSPLHGFEISSETSDFHH
ncbi:MAG: response regulator transcription factor, partial [Halococcoides sp.]